MYGSQQLFSVSYTGFGPFLYSPPHRTPRCHQRDRPASSWTFSPPSFVRLLHWRSFQPESLSLSWPVACSSVCVEKTLRARPTFLTERRRACTMFMFTAPPPLSPNTAGSFWSCPRIRIYERADHRAHARSCWWWRQHCDAWKWVRRRYSNSSRRRNRRSETIIFLYPQRLACFS